MNFWNDHSVVRLMLLTFAVSLGVWGWLQVSLSLLPHVGDGRSGHEPARADVSLAADAGVDTGAHHEPLRAAWSLPTR